MANLRLFEPHAESFQDYFTRVFQSSNINFVIGAGASHPAIDVAGDIESQLQRLYDEGEDAAAEMVEYGFLRTIRASAVKLTRVAPPTPEIDQSYEVLVQYEKFIAVVERILRARKNNLLPKKVNIFSTNYDLFIERAALLHKSVVLNDGFQTRSSLKSEYFYDTRSFSRIFFESSALYDYKVELPVINLIKIHGSISWRINRDMPDQIVYSVVDEELPEAVTLTAADRKKNLEDSVLIFPKKEKFKTTLLNRTYYDLLRLYSNELDKEQTTLIAFGFSFRDEHIFDITRRSLRNSTLKLIIFSYDLESKDYFNNIFSQNHNVDIIYPGQDQKINFESFNKAIESFARSEV